MFSVLETNDRHIDRDNNQLIIYYQHVSYLLRIQQCPVINKYLQYNNTLMLQVTVESCE